MEEIIEELQNNLTISPLIGPDDTPPRSPLTPSPSPFDSDIVMVDTAANQKTAFSSLTNQNSAFSDSIDHTTSSHNVDIPKKSSLSSSSKKSVEYRIPVFGVTPPDDERSQKTTDGILKAARLGDLKMLTELYQEGEY